jgi:hypothetical protein
MVVAGLYGRHSPPHDHPQIISILRPYGNQALDLTCDLQVLQRVTTAQRTSESETEAIGLGKLGTSPFGSRMPKENSG